MGATGPWTYTCAPGFTNVFTNAALGNLDTTARNITTSAPIEGATVYFVFTVHLPRAYADSYRYQNGACSTSGVAGVSEQLQNCTLSITYHFVATQRAPATQ